MGGHQLLDLGLQRFEAVLGSHQVGGEFADELGGAALADHARALSARRVECGFGQLPDGGPVGAVPTQVAADPRGTGLPDLGGGDVARKQQQAGLLGRVHDAFQARVDAGQQVAQATDAGGGLLGQRGAVADQEPQFDGGLLGQSDGPQVVAEHDLLGDHPGITRVGLVLPSPGAAAGPVDGQAGHVDAGQAGGQQHRGQQSGDAAHQVQPDGQSVVFGLDGTQLADGLFNRFRVVADPVAEQRSAAVVDGGQPVEVLADVEARGGGHDAPLAVQRVARLLPPVLALLSDGPQSLISSPEEVAGQGEQPLQPSRAASMKSIPAPLARPHRRERPGRAKEGRTA